MKAKGDIKGLKKALSYEKGRYPHSVRCQAAGALGEIGGDQAISLLINALKDRQCQVRHSATKALGKIGDSRAVEPLISVLKHDNDELVRKTVIEALGNIGDPQAIEPLDGVLDYERESRYDDLDYDSMYYQPYHKKAADALVKIGLPAVDALRGHLEHYIPFFSLTIINPI